jgi:hypothetical protein
MSSDDELKREGDVKMARKTNGIGRRKILKGAAGLAGAAVGSGVIGAPMIWAQNNKNIVLRQCGTGVSAFNEIAEKAKADLGFTLQMTALDSDAVVQRVVTQRTRSTSATSSTGWSRRSSRPRTCRRWTRSGSSCSTRSCRSSPPAS